jgi:hypothetical protein
VERVALKSLGRHCQLLFRSVTEVGDDLRAAHGGVAFQRM